MPHAQRASPFGPEAAKGVVVLKQAVQIAERLFGERLVAAYAPGSLAHGGFSALVSDVDLGLVLREPLAAQDAIRVDQLAAEVKAGGARLSDRLSVFWGDSATLAGAGSGGHFPPLDRLDLKQYGRLLAGRDVRDQVATPTTRELVLETARMALKNMSTPEVTARLRDSDALVNAGPRVLTKRILFPVRFIYTARTGEVGRNEAAVDYFVAAETGPAADLARRGYQWRSTPYAPDDPAVQQAVERGLLPIYGLFIEDYEGRLREYGDQGLADGFGTWHQRLE